MAQTLPDRRRPSGLPEGPALARKVGDAALALTWRLVQPADRHRYAAGANQEPLTRLHYKADDGWTADLFHVPSAQVGGGEPVVLAHGLGGGHRDFALEQAGSLALALAEAGFSVYLLEHRGDRSATPPHDAGPFSVDDIAIRDVPAAIDVVCEHSGFPRVLWVGHALGAQLLHLSRALGAESRIAAAVVIAGAVAFDMPATAARTAAAVATLLPPNWTLPGRRASQLASPFVTRGDAVASPRTPGELARGRLRYASGDLHGGVLKQMARWFSHGHLTDGTGRLEIVPALAPLPMLVVSPDADPACPQGACDPLLGVPGAVPLDLRGGWGHLDPLLGADAASAVYTPAIRFLDEHRRTCDG